MTEFRETTGANVSRRDSVLSSITRSAAGGGIALLLVLIVLLATNNSRPGTLATVFLVGAVVLAAGFVAHGLRVLLTPGKPGVGIAFAIALAWVAFALVQIGTLMHHF